MNLRKLLLTKNACYKAGKKITVKGIMVHSTGANNPKLSRYVGPDDGLLGVNPNGNHWNQDKPGGRQTCVHAFIGKLKDGSIAAYQCLPWNMRGWHGASGSKGCVNDTHIGFEICEDAIDAKKAECKEYFAKVYRKAVELCAYLCKEYNLDPMKDGVLICHSEGFKRGIASNHGDVMHWFPKFGKSMDTFRADVSAELGKTVKPATPPKSATVVTLKRLLRVKRDKKGKTIYPLMKGEDVGDVQKALIKLGYSVGKAGVDGIYGSDTEKAVTAYQKANKLTVDGIVGKQTATALGFKWEG